MSNISPSIFKWFIDLLVSLFKRNPKLALEFLRQLHIKLELELLKKNNEEELNKEFFLKLKKKVEKEHNKKCFNKNNSEEPDTNSNSKVSQIEGANLDP